MFDQLLIAIGLEAERTRCGFIPSFYLATLRRLNPAGYEAIMTATGRR